MANFLYNPYTKPKNSIFFGLYIFDQRSKCYYSILYHALKSLSNSVSSILSANFDVVVYYCVHPDVEFDILSHEVNENNLFKDFPNVKFVNYTFSHDPNKHPNDKFLFKWSALDHFFENFNYNVSLVLDSDVHFFDDPSTFFDNYNDPHSIFGIYESTPPEIKSGLNLSHDCYNGGQFYLSRECYNQLKPLCSNISSISKAFCSQAKSKDLPKFIQNNISLWGDQISISHLISQTSLARKSFQNTHISYGSPYCIDLHKHGYTISSNTIIVHYLSGASWLFLSKDEKSEHHMLKLSHEKLNKRLNQLQHKNKTKFKYHQTYLL